MFHRRFFGAVILAATVIGVSLMIGTAGYHYIAGFEWIDALLNAAMILTGMGPVGALTSVSAKLFASAYALFSGFVLITSSGIILSPMLHRVLHKFHADEQDLQ